jgi:hypothetical protein
MTEKKIGIKIGPSNTLYKSAKIIIGDSQNTVVTIDELREIEDIGSDMIAFRGKTMAVIPSSRIVAVVPND